MDFSCAIYIISLLGTLTLCQESTFHWRNFTRLHDNGNLFLMFNSSQLGCMAACMEHVKCTACSYAFKHGTCELFNASSKLMDAKEWATFQKRKGFVYQRGNLRLVDGLVTKSAGRAEMKNDQNEWGTICDSSFGSNGWPTVFCKDLGFTGAAQSKAVAKVINVIAADPSQPITLHEPGCISQNAQNMLECGTNVSQCSHSKDVWVNCF